MAPFLLRDGPLLSLAGKPTPAVTTPTTTEPFLFGRQAPATVTVYAERDNSDHLGGGAIAGIIIGSVVGILLLLWVIRSCFNLGASPQEREILYHDVEPKRHRHHSRHSRQHSRRRDSSDLSAPPPVVIREHSQRRQQQQPTTYVYKEGDTGRRGRHVVRY